MLMLALAWAAKDTEAFLGCLSSDMHFMEEMSLMGPLGEVTSRKRGHASFG